MSQVRCAEPASMRKALHAEWTKLRTMAGTIWLLAAATRCPPGPACPVDAAKLSPTGVQLGQAVIAILAVLAISGEYSAGMIRATRKHRPDSVHPPQLWQL